MGDSPRPVEDLARDWIARDLSRDVSDRLGKNGRPGKNGATATGISYGRWLVGGGVVLLVVVLVAGGLVALGGGDGDKPRVVDRPSAPSAGEQPPNRPAPSFVVPHALDRTALERGLDVVSVPSTTVTDPNALGLTGDLLTAYQQHGLLLRQTGFLFGRGIDPADEPGWPEGVEGSLNYGVSYFQTREDALAVQRSSETNLRTAGYRTLDRPDLEKLGITVFEPVEARDGLVTQIWYWVRDNALLAVAGTGKLAEGAPRPDQRALFDKLDRALRPEARASGPAFTESEAATAYTEAVAPVNAAASAFASATQGWSSSTTSAQATADAAPLAAALEDVEAAMLTLGGRYEAARPQIWPVVAALEALRDDLRELARLEQTGVETWLQQYDAHLAGLTAASNTLRAALDLPATAT